LALAGRQGGIGINISNLFKEKNLVFSLEVFPPKKTSAIDTIYKTLARIGEIPADFVSVTYGACGSLTERSKTYEIAGLIKKTYAIEPLFHLTCVGARRGEIVRILDELKTRDISNILTLRGDLLPGAGEVSDFSHASDLASFIKKQDPAFNLVGACYPEVHAESADLVEDIANLKKKIDSGVSHLISQLFFDNEVFYNFIAELRRSGINVPVQAGIMPIIKKSQIERIVTMSGASLPQPFSHLVSHYADDPVALEEAGIEYAAGQILDLIANGVQGIHLYTMNNMELAVNIDRLIRPAIEKRNAIKREG